ncbi:hypothetical protein ELQ90_01490 [Labedella phragmitis]|uniref:Uncharacterized protein n=1 Tax=Labedella phragmitis TaxID=2498849 RepID=A0A444PXW8_9MICO|nr:hypothetical protein ELQ90_01490 [Labedella phragmitis]
MPTARRASSTACPRRSGRGGSREGAGECGGGRRRRTGRRRSRRCVAMRSRVRPPMCRRRRR